MDNICDKKVCTGCAACAEVCPMHCIAMVYDEEGYLNPSIDNSVCVNCGKCAKTCPNNSPVPKWGEAEFLQVWNKDKEVLVKSSSGGFFTALAQYIFAREGVVFGVYKDPATNVLRFDYAEDLAGIDKFRYSKYYQAETGSVYRQVREFIEAGRLVLFTGTGCQVAGLLNYLGDSYNRDLLITADPLCHGTPSKKAVDAYIKDKEKEYKKKIVDYSFRIKPDDGHWYVGGSTRMKLYFEDNTVEIVEQGRDSFFLAFNENIILRESCYTCKYCGSKRISDFTMADFWCVKDVPQEQQDYGVTLLLCNSNRARNMVRELSDLLVIEEADKAVALANNGSLTKANARPRARDGVYESIDKKGFDRTVIANFKKHYLRLYLEDHIGRDTFKKIRNILHI